MTKIEINVDAIKKGTDLTDDTIIAQALLVRAGMMRRCYNDKHKHYHGYEGRPSLQQHQTEMITISRLQYESLLRDMIKLEALEMCGVDNWEGYDDAMDLFREVRDAREWLEK